MRLGQRRDEAPPEYKVPPEDFYVARFRKYDDPVPSAFANRDTGEYEDRIRLVFAIDDPDAEQDVQGAEVSMYCDVEVNAFRKQSIYHVLLALDPEHEPEGGEDLDDYKGKKVRIEVVHKTKGDKTYANIGAIKPARRQRASSAPKEDDRELVGASSRGSKKSVFNVDDE